MWDKAKQFDEPTSQENKLLTLDELKMDSRDGKWSLKLKTKNKIQKGDREVFEKQEVSGPVDIIILRGNRRSLMKTGKLGKIIETTREFTNKNKPTMLMNFDTKVNKVVTPADIGNNGYKSTNYVYCLYNNKLVKLVLKGGQVKTAEKIKGLNDYYTYLYSFKGDERPYQSVTRLEPVAYSTELGQFYTINFQAIKSVSDPKTVDLIVENLQTVKENLEKYDSQPLNTNTTESKADEFHLDMEETTVDYGEAINPNDIPF